LLNQTAEKDHFLLISMISILTIIIFQILSLKEANIEIIGLRQIFPHKEDFLLTPADTKIVGLPLRIGTKRTISK
jgi:hypothetical protein